MKIRTAKPEDAPAIAHIHVATWQATYRGIVPAAYLASLNEADFTTRWAEWLRGEASILISVAEQGTDLIGFASGGPIRKPVPNYDAELYAIYILPNAHRTGLGRKLVSGIADHLRSQGHTHMLVWVLRDNPAATFYQHLEATLVTEDTVDIGGSHLPELAFGWPLTHPALTSGTQGERSPV